MNDFKYIWICYPTDYSHSAAFEEIALSLHDAFHEIGMPVRVVRERPKDGCTLVLGCHLLQGNPPGDYVMYNMEQIENVSPWITGRYIEMLKHYPVWDYSLNNIKALKERGIEAVHCPIGYMPCLTRIPEVEQDIDVLFYGSFSMRREKIFKALEGRVTQLYPGIYGKPRDEYIARAKIVLNVHYYPSKIFEIARCSYLYANKKAVVSEIGEDSSLEFPFYAAQGFADYDHLVEKCLDLLGDSYKRQQCAERGFEVFSRMNQAEILRGII